MGKCGKSPLRGYWLYMVIFISSGRLVGLTWNKFDQFSRDTSHVSVRPIKSILAAINQDGSYFPERWSAGEGESVQFREKFANF